MFEEKIWDQGPHPNPMAVLRFILGHLEQIIGICKPLSSAKLLQPCRFVRHAELKE